MERGTTVAEANARAALAEAAGIRFQIACVVAILANEPPETVQKSRVKRVFAVYTRR
jgi:hypothetical protein